MWRGGGLKSLCGGWRGGGLKGVCVGVTTYSRPSCGERIVADSIFVLWENVVADSVFVLWETVVADSVFVLYIVFDCPTAIVLTVFDCHCHDDDCFDCVIMLTVFACQTVITLSDCAYVTVIMLTVLYCVRLLIMLSVFACVRMLQCCQVLTVSDYYDTDSF